MSEQLPPVHTMPSPEAEGAASLSVAAMACDGIVHVLSSRRGGAHTVPKINRQKLPTPFDAVNNL